MRGVRLMTCLFAGGVLAGCTAILGDFDVGNSPTPPDDGSTTDTTSSSDGGPGDDTGPANDAPPPNEAGDAPLTCPSPQVVCTVGSTQVCADRSSSPDHCGACGHSCGGGTCTQGRCQPVLIYQGTTIGPVALDLNDVFFESNEDPSFKLMACPKTSCKSAPRQVTIMPFTIDAIDTPAPGTIAYLSAPQNSSGTERPAVFSCPATGCPSPPTSFVGDGLNGIQTRLRSAGGTEYGVTGGTGLFLSACANGSCATPVTFFGTLTKGIHGFIPAPVQNAVYFIDSPTRGSTIAKCTIGDTACTPASLVPGDASLVEALVVFNGKLWWLIPGRDGFMEGKLVSCDLPACATVTPSAGAIDSPKNLVVDSSGAWWLTAGGKLQHCLPNGCTGGQQDVVASLDTPHDLLADDAFVYWAEKTKISRIAK